MPDTPIADKAAADKAAADKAAADKAAADKAAADKAAADKAAADKAAAEKAAADAAAKKAADDAAAAEDAKKAAEQAAEASKKPTKNKIVRCGVLSRGSFAAYGEFDPALDVNTVTVAGFQVRPTCLKEDVVKGPTPNGLEIGTEVVVKIGDASITTVVV